MATQRFAPSGQSFEPHVGYTDNAVANGFMAAPIYSQKVLAEQVTAAGFHAFREHVLPHSFYSGGKRVACLKYFCGFISLRQGPEEAYRHLSEIAQWERVILAIHDFRHEYLPADVENEATVAAARTKLRRMLATWIDGIPRLRHRITVGAMPRAGLVTIESHQVNGRPDLEALQMFLTGYLAQHHLTNDITDAFTGSDTQSSVPVRVSKSWLHKHLVAPILSRWTEGSFVKSDTTRH